VSAGSQSGNLVREPKLCLIVEEFRSVPPEELAKTLGDEQPRPMPKVDAERRARALEALRADPDIGKAFSGGADMMYAIKAGPRDDGVEVHVSFATAVDLPSALGMPVYAGEGEKVPPPGKDGWPIAQEADPSMYKGVLSASFFLDERLELRYIVPSKEREYCWVEYNPNGGWRPVK
jgi:hypothetical protein